MTTQVRAGALLTGLLAAALLVLSGCATASQAARAAQVSARSAAAASGVTTSYTYRPYTGHGRARIAVARTASGSCFTSSLADTSPTAFRCFAGSAILDPCFAASSTNRHPATLLCVADPWAAATRLRLTTALPAATPATAARPWALRLADGTHCVAATGTVPAVGGVNLDYRCTDGRSAALVDAGARRLTAVTALPAATVIRHQSVTAVWRR